MSFDEKEEALETNASPVAKASPAPKAVIPANATDANASFFMPSNPRSIHRVVHHRWAMSAADHHTVPVST
jgi:hypothetical protein